MNRMKILKLRKAIVKGSESLTDETATTVPELFDKWKPDTEYVAGERRTFGNTLYKCLLDHRSQEDWTPDIAVSLWVRTSAEEWPEWIQPTGVHDAYNTGDKVRHNGKHWISLVDGNGWEPGVYGWEEVS